METELTLTLGVIAIVIAIVVLQLWVLDWDLRCLIVECRIMK